MVACWKFPINGGAFVDILAAGGSFVSNGYNATISTDAQEPDWRPRGLGKQFCRLRSHGGEPRSQRQRTDDQAALSHGDRRGLGVCRMAD